MSRSLRIQRERKLTQMRAEHKRELTELHDAQHEELNITNVLSISKNKLKLKTAKMETKHEKQLVALQDAQREQLLSMFQNKDILEEMVDDFKSTINELNDKKTQLSTTNKILLQNQRSLKWDLKYFIINSCKYAKILDIICKQFETFNKKLLENEHMMTECMANASAEYSTTMTVLCQKFNLDD